MPGEENERSFKNTYKIRRTITKGIKEKLSLLEISLVSHIGRQGNQVAHNLAHNSLFKANKVWMEEIPQILV